MEFSPDYDLYHEGVSYSPNTVEVRAVAGFLPQWPIEELRREYLDSVVRLEEQGFAELHGRVWGRDFFKSVVQNYYARAITDNRGVIGLVVAMIAGTDTDEPDPLIGTAGEIGHIVVSREYQGQGIGEKLLRCGVELLKRRGSEHIVLRTRVDNGPMIHLAEKVGFEITSVLPFYYSGINQSAYVMTWRGYPNLAQPVK